jgi:dienelactone hydrolase
MFRQFFLIAVLALAPAAPAWCTGAGVGVPAVAAGPGGAEADAPGRRQLWLIPSPEPGVMMRAYLFRPPGDGPFPLAVINHGSEEDPFLRVHQAMPAFDRLTAWFLARGYAVLLPQRPGHGATGGRYLESQGRDCGHARFYEAGLGAARSIAAAIAFMAAEPFIRPGKAVVVGNSAGGWGALALASTNPPDVAAVINFAGGRGGHDPTAPGGSCAPDRLVAAAAAYGRTARIPTLWLYAANDSYFPPALSQRMADAYRAAGGSAEYHLLPALAGDGHGLAFTAEGAAAWGPVVERFVRMTATRERKNGPPMPFGRAPFIDRSPLSPRPLASPRADGAKTMSGPSLRLVDARVN